MKQNGCVVYSLGIAGNSAFEEIMATKIGCDVHAFDCTINNQAASVKGKHFHFHEWCIGSNKEVDMGGLNDNYLKGEKKTETLIFKSLSDSMKELGHSQMDLLKFDIEGFEWQLFTEELLKGKVLPKQISFEMHTQGAKDWSVPVSNTKGRSNHEVNNAFLALHKLGYRVVSKERNRHDHACAEFVMVLV